MNDYDSLDRLIEKSLATLRDATPSPALEARTRAAIDRAAARPARRPWLWPALAVTTACALLIAILTTLSHVTPSRAPQISSLVHRPDLSSSNHGASLGSASGALKPQSSSLLPLQKPLSSKQRTSFGDAGKQQDPEAALALAETNAASHPAPALPLTAQERILIRATRSGELSELAELRPAREAALREALEARARLAIQRYAHQLLAPLAASEAIQPTVPDELPPVITSAPATDELTPPTPQSNTP